MKNKRIITLLALVIAIGVLMTSYLLIKANTGDKTNEENASDGDVHINNFAADSMTDLNYKNDKGDLSFVKKANGVWVLESNEDYPVSSSAIDNMANAVSGASAVRTVENGDEASFGFNTPALTVSGKYSDGSALSLTFGITNSFNGNVYVRDDSSGKIYLAESTLGKAFDYTLNEITETDSLPADIDEEYLTSFTVRDEIGKSVTITDSNGLEKAFSAMQKLDFSKQNCYYTDGGDLLNYGISDSSPYIELKYKAQITASDSGENAPRADAEFKVIFGSNHTLTESDTDSSGETYENDKVTYYYTVPASKLVYSLDAGAYESLMSLVSYTPAADTETTD